MGLIDLSTKILIGPVIHEWKAAIGLLIIGVFMNFRDDVEFCWINPMIETTQIESKIRGDKSTVNRHEPFARINYTKAINIPVLLLDFTI